MAKKTDRVVAEKHIAKAKPLSTGEWYVTSTEQFDVLAERLEVARNIIEAHRAYIKQLRFENDVLKSKLAKAAEIELEYTELQADLADRALYVHK